MELSADNAARCAAEVVQAVWAIYQDDLNPELPPYGGQAAAWEQELR